MDQIQVAFVGAWPNQFGRYFLIHHYLIQPLNAVTIGNWVGFLQLFFMRF
jgi:hypothetical protein